MQNPSEGTYKLRVLKLSAIAIASVVTVEVTLGLFVNSLAILSDGLHALLDALSTVMLFVAARASMKPPDEEHTYGHEKFEAIGGLIGGIVLVAVALLIFYEAAVRLMGNIRVNEGLQLAGYFAIGYTLCIDFFRVTVFRSAGHSQSMTVKAGFYDAISDLGSTIIALLGFALATFGFYYGDSVASVFLGTMLIYLSIRLARTSIMELSDTASKEMVQRIKKEIVSQEGVQKNENLRVRKVGSKIFVETTVQVSSRMSLDEAHALASKIEGKLKESFGNVDATIHIEPLEKEPKMEQLVEKLATVDGVREVHEISTVYASGKLYITLHAYVDPKLSVEEAHEIAEKIENRMHASIKQLENVTVHVEPYDTEVRVSGIDENKLKEIILNVAKGVEQNLYVKRIVTYKAAGKLYINLDCCFTKQASVAGAHGTASRIEKEIREKFADSVVTVHMEPGCK
jgi:cation diffusion facilitator family transporter